MTGYRFAYVPGATQRKEEEEEEERDYSAIFHLVHIALNLEFMLRTASMKQQTSTLKSNVKI